MTLAHFLQALGELVVDHQIDPNQEIAQIAYDSKSVGENCLFICKGANFKTEYLEEAQKNGAVCYLAREKMPLAGHYIVLSDLRLALGKVVALFFGDHSQKIPLLGITGTKGKTTTALLLRSILDCHYSQKSALLCSILCDDGVAETPSRLTTKEPIELNTHIQNAIASHCPALTMEVSSQAVKYHRIYGLHFEMGCYLNIGEDHISPQEHPDFQDYFQSKLAFFQQCRHLSVHLDGVHTDQVLKAVPENTSLVTCSRQHAHADFFVSHIQKKGISTQFVVETPRGTEEYTIAMAGLFNVDNALIAISVAHHLGIDSKTIATGLLLGRSPGRMELYASADEKIHILVDYAHNKMSFQALFTSILQEFPQKKIVAVFGCPGEKALDRRADMGKIADQYAHFCFLSEDDPGNEEVSQICQEIAQHMPKKQYEIQPNRKLAIEQACNLYPQQDKIVLLLGKGAESDQKRGNFYVEHPSDAQLAQAFLQGYDKIPAL